MFKNLKFGQLLKYHFSENMYEKVIFINHCDCIFSLWGEDNTDTYSIFFIREAYLTFPSSDALIKNGQIYVSETTVHKSMLDKSFEEINENDQTKKDIIAQRIVRLNGAQFPLGNIV